MSIEAEPFKAAFEAVVSTHEDMTKATEALEAAGEQTRIAEQQVVEVLTGNYVYVTGRTTHQYEPMEPYVERQRRLLLEVVKVEAVQYDTTAQPPLDNMQIERWDGTKWLMKVSNTKIECADDDAPKDGSYVCKSCDEPTVVAVDEKHPHGCPVEGGTCGSRDCNVTGSCQA